MKRRRSPRRVWTPRPPGLDPALRAPFWRGDTAQSIIKQRREQYRADDAAKLARRSRRGT